jgi:hypothetical protein
MWKERVKSIVINFIERRSNERKVRVAHKQILHGS